MWKYTLECGNHVKRLIPSLLQNTTECFPQQTRNTYVFKRKYQVPLLRKGEHFRKLKAKFFIYELVENRNYIKPKPIDIILLKDVDNVGEKGDKLSMHPAIAYNKFLLPKIAVYASPENMEKLYVSREKRLEVYSSKCVKQTIDVLKTTNVAVEMSSITPWTIEKWHIRVAFRKIRYMVPEHAITLPPKPISGPNTDLEDKQFYVTITINKQEQVKVRCTLKHFDNAHVRYNQSLYSQKGTAVFSEDQIILDEMPVIVRVKKQTSV